MKILHLTDLHYNSKTYEKLSQKNTIKKLIESIAKYHNEIDLVFFTGDLVYSGTVYEDFEEAKINFILKISTALNLPVENIIFCAGNHDMDRTTKSDALEEHFNNKIKNESDLRKIFDNKQ